MVCKEVVKAGNVAVSAASPLKVAGRLVRHCDKV